MAGSGPGTAEPRSGLAEGFTQSIMSEKTSAIIRSPICHPTPSAMSGLSLNSCRDGDSITSCVARSNG